MICGRGGSGGSPAASVMAAAVTSGLARWDMPKFTAPTTKRSAANVPCCEVTLSLPRRKLTSVTSASGTRSVVKMFLTTSVSEVKVTDWASARPARKPQAARANATAIQMACETWFVQSVSARSPAAGR